MTKTAKLTLSETALLLEAARKKYYANNQMHGVAEWHDAFLALGKLLNYRGKANRGKTLDVPVDLIAQCAEPLYALAAEMDTQEWLDRTLETALRENNESCIEETGKPREDLDGLSASLTYLIAGQMAVAQVTALHVRSILSTDIT